MFQYQFSQVLAIRSSILDFPAILFFDEIFTKVLHYIFVIGTFQPQFIHIFVCNEWLGHLEQDVEKIRMVHNVHLTDSKWNCFLDLSEVDVTDPELKEKFNELTHSRIVDMKEGLIEKIWLNERPSQFTIPVPPFICDIGSISINSTANCAARKTSIGGIFDGSHSGITI